VDLKGDAEGAAREDRGRDPSGRRGKELYLGIPR
jgi:hypothetical protein